VREIGRATAEQVSATAIDWNFSPTLAVARDLRWGRTYEAFSSDPAIVTELGRAAILGLQGEPGENWLASPRVLATAKHFVGDGGTFEGEDQGDTRLSEKELYDIHGLPYPAAIEAGVQAIMVSFSSWNGQKMHGHRYLLTEVLKERMGFDGIVVGDWNGHGQVPGCSVTDCLKAFEAGVDLFMVPEDWEAFRDTMLEHAHSGRLSMDRLDDAVRRILRVKKRAGLFDRPVPDGSDQLPNADAHAELARRAVRQSLVLLKNNGGVLPLNPGARILVVGDGADDIGKQSGGWTLTWQGMKDANDHFPNGQSIFHALAEQVRTAGGEIRLGESGAEEFDPDVVIAIYGEDPYAEGQGDVETLEFQPGTRGAVELLDRFGQLGVPVVSVFLSGRPLWTNPEMNRSDAFVAAWLPGTAGGGVADVLLAGADGDIQYDFAGRLPFAWPAAPKANDDSEWPTLFPLGSGLRYGEGGLTEPLPEDAMAPLLEDVIPDQGDWVLFDGTTRMPWRLLVIGHNNAADPIIELTDRLVQGDARRVTWAEATPGIVMLQARPPVSLKGFLDDNAVLAYDLRLEAPIPDDLSVRLTCGQECASAALDLTSELADRPIHEWSTLRIDLACFASENMDLSQVSGTELLRTNGPARISLGAVRIERQAMGSADLNCSP
ncbi:MAG: glycoside hydrolase family 3 N-terminal domain-containing protein, partial [Wenzhouxiangella sp.]